MARNSEQLIQVSFGLRQGLAKVSCLALCLGWLLVLPFESTAAWKPKAKAEPTAPSQEARRAIREFRRLEGLDDYFSEADAFVVFPAVAKAGIGLGGATGRGEVIKKGKVIALSRLYQLTVGIQLGGQAYSEIIFFQTQADTDRFLKGGFELSAQASAVLIDEGVSTDLNFKDGLAIFTLSKGGLMYEATVAGQKFSVEVL